MQVYDVLPGLPGRHLRGGRHGLGADAEVIPPPPRIFCMAAEVEGKRDHLATVSCLRGLLGVPRELPPVGKIWEAA